MSAEKDIVMTEAELCGKLSEVSSDGQATALTQGYLGTGFGRVRAGDVNSPAQVEWRLQPSGAPFDPNYSFDIRLFGNLGEWHWWSIGERKWRGRYASANAPDWQAESTKRARTFVLWGTRIAAREDGWVRLVEDRGIDIWVPANVTSLPIILPVQELLAQEEDTGIAIVRDAMLRPMTGARS